MTLTNPSFESDWSEQRSHTVRVFPVGGDPYQTEVGNIFTPPGWIAWFRHEEGVLAQPECRDTSARNPDRMHDGQKGFLLFTFGRRHDAGLMQQVDTRSGQRLRFTAWAHAWSNHEDASRPGDFPHPDDPYWSEGAGYDLFYARAGDVTDDNLINFRFSVGIDPLGGLDPFAPSVVWGDEAHIYNGYRELPEAEVVAQSDQATVFLRSRTTWPFKHNDAYWDDASLTVVADPPPVELYARTVHLVPQDVMDDEDEQVREAVRDEKNTHTFSADDAFAPNKWGDPHRVIVWDVDRWGGKTALKDWVRQRFGKLPDAIDYRRFAGDPPPPPVQPPPTVGQLGMHQLANQPQGLAEFMALGPPIFKAVDRIDQVIAAYWFTPEHLRTHTRYLYRKYRPDEGDFRYRPDVRAAAAEWVNQSGGCPDLAAELAAAGVPTSRVIYLGPNETWEYDISKNQKAIDLDFAIIDELIAFNAAHGTSFSYAASSMAVGNPALPSENEDQWFRILPLARRLRDTAGAGLGAHNCLNYHAYGLCHPDHPEYLVDLAPFLQNRWMEYWLWLDAHGVAVPFVHGEGGHVGGEPDWLNPGQGWNGLIPADRAIRELLDHFDEPARAFNAAHGYRASFGLTVFQWGNSTDWGKFNCDPLTNDLIKAIRGKYLD